jgi:branched-chain amino acid aminotransferase
MINECFGDTFILNGSLQPAEIFDNSLVYEGESVYEVLRVVKGTPVFFNDHAERLKTSVKLQDRQMLASIDDLYSDICTLSKSEKKRDVNLKIVFNYNNSEKNYLVYFIQPIYPGADQYRKGVKGILFYAERKDPEAKVINHKLRSEIYHKLILENAYEALLVNNNNCITEGSRTNIFIIGGQKLYTAPDKDVLSGITRKHILEICRENKITVEFRSVNADNLPDYESVFMSGTSPVILPFCCIGDTHFNINHELISFLRARFLEKVEKSMTQFKGNISKM